MRCSRVQLDRAHAAERGAPYELRCSRRHAPYPGLFAMHRLTVPSGLTAPEVWDAIPFLAKLQIIGAIGVFEHISEDKNL